MSTLKLTFLGHAGFRLDGSLSLVIDPYLEGNPIAPCSVADVTDVDWVLATHDHADHWPDSLAVAKATGAGMVAQYELAAMAGEDGISRVEPMGIGGTVDLGAAKVHGVNAQHSAGTGQAMGFVVEMDGHRVYHMGDTGLFGDMALIGEWFEPTIALVPTGDRFTMGLESALRSLDLVRPQIAIPMHFGTFPLILDNGAEFVRRAAGKCEALLMEPGESRDFPAP